MSKSVTKQDEANLLQKITDMDILFKCQDHNVVSLIFGNAINLSPLETLSLIFSNALSFTPEETLTLVSKINDYVYNFEYLTLHFTNAISFSEAETLSLSVEVTH